MFDTLIVTGADRNFYALLTGLVDSIRDNTDGGIPIGVLDFGLEAEQRGILERRGLNVVTPGRDFDGREHDTWVGNTQALTVRPFLPRYFPGYEIYLWIDADVWVQDASAIDLYLSVARANRLAITPHIGRSYKSFKKWPRPRFNTLMFREYRKGWGWRTANELGKYPIANAGVFALKADAPHWELWRRAMAGRPTRMWDQTALNYVIHHDKAAVGLLPDWCNWIAIDAPPKMDEVNGMLVEPEPPYRPIGMIHLVGPAKSLRFQLETLKGGRMECPLTYAYWRAQRRVPAAAVVAD